MVVNGQQGCNDDRQKKEKTLKRKKEKELEKKEGWTSIVNEQ